MNKWDVRFGSEDFLYGKEPNVFFAEFLSNQSKKGKILLPAEGDGRNAIFAAKLGWDVHAFDSSKVARQKALKYADAENVKITYDQQDIITYLSGIQKYDLVALVFVHLPVHMRFDFHQKMMQSLKPGGILLVESFAKEQINNRSGGPPNIDMLFSTQMLKEDFSELTIKKLCQEQVSLDEGYHHGKADVVRMVGVKE